MLRFASLAAVLMVASFPCPARARSGPVDALDRAWFHWRLQHGKVYSSAVEEMRRKAIWARNWDFLQNNRSWARHNGFDIELNVHSDKDPKELVHRRGSIPSRPLAQGPQQIPDSFDWRQKGCVSAVHNQGEMGGSIVFDIIDAAETKCCKESGKIFSLSIQQVLDCCMIDGRLPVKDVYGCLKHHGGMCSEADYPSSARPGTCKQCSGVCRVDSTGNVPPGNEEILKAAVWNTSAIVTLNAANQAFQMYRSGIFRLDNCDPKELDHTMQAVGYGSADGVDYWILKNSWGAEWGEQGYMRLLRGKNMCGVAQHAFGPL